MPTNDVDEEQRLEGFAGIARFEAEIVDYSSF
jgi:hypothetical protein